MLKGAINLSEKNKYYSIGKVSSICDVPIKTLRYYDQIGLLVPQYRKEDSHYRYYEHTQLLTLHIIRKTAFVRRFFKRYSENHPKL